MGRVCADEFEKRILERVSERENAVFIFNTESGIRRYEVQRYKNAEVLRLCREMSGHSFRSIRSMLRGNGFYKNKIGIFGTRKF